MTKSWTAYLKRLVTSPAGQAFCVALLVFWIILFPLWWLGTGWITDRFIADEKNAGQQYLISVRDVIDDAANQDYAVLVNLSNNIQADSSSPDSSQEFAAYSREFMSRREVRSISIKQKGAPEKIYYPHGREAVTVTENQSLHIMKLIYVDGKYWGIATITIDLPDLLEKYDTAFDRSGMDLIVIDHKGEVLLGNSRVLSQDPVVQNLILPQEHILKLAAVPDGGWAYAAETRVATLRYLGVAIIFLIALLLGLITYRQVSLHNVLRERTNALLKTNSRLRQEILDRARADQALEASEKKYFTLFNSANDAVVLCARRENPLCYPLIEVNDGTSRILGYSRDSLLSGNLFDHVLPSSRERIPKIFEEIDRNHHATFEMNYQTCDGRTIPLEMNSHLFILEGKTVLLTVARDISARKKIENDLRQSIAEKEVLLQEVHHRVKNNLQVILSLIELQSAAMSNPDAREHFRECQDRIRSIALVHENLYQSKNFSTIKAENYIKMLVDRLVQSCSPFPGISVCYDIDDIDTDLDTAIPCGLVINELVTNALKHAFTGRDRGIIQICLKQAPDDMLTLIVEDDGKGFPESINFKDTESFGLQIVMALSRQLDADVSMTSENGTRITLRFSEIRGKTGV